MPYAHRIDNDNQKIFEYDVVKIGENTYALVIFVEEKCAFMLYYNNQYVPLTTLDTMEVVGVVGNILINPELNTFNLNV